MSESLEILPNNTLYFMGSSRRVVGLCLAYFRLLKNKFQIWKQREPRPSWGATGGRIPHTQWLVTCSPSHSGLTSLMRPLTTPPQEFAVCTSSSSFSCCCIAVHSEYLCLLDWELFASPSLSIAPGT